MVQFEENNLLNQPPPSPYTKKMFTPLNTTELDGRGRTNPLSSQWGILTQPLRSEFLEHTR